LILVCFAFHNLTLGCLPLFFGFIVDHVPSPSPSDLLLERCPFFRLHLISVSCPRLSCFAVDFSHPLEGRHTVGDFPLSQIAHPPFFNERVEGAATCNFSGSEHVFRSFETFQAECRIFFFLCVKFFRFGQVNIDRPPPFFFDFFSPDVACLGRRSVFFLRVSLSVRPLSLL